MPTIFIHYPREPFTDDALASLANELTTIGLECEKLPSTPFVRSTVWIYAKEHDFVFVGGQAGGAKVISVEVNVFEGGLDDASKQALIARFTAAVGRYAGMPACIRLPVYVLIREAPASNWGVFGERITLESLRNPAVDALTL